MWGSLQPPSTSLPPSGPPFLIHPPTPPPHPTPPFTPHAPAHTCAYQWPSHANAAATQGPPLPSVAAASRN